MTERFALIGAAGYIAPRHLKAIKETGNLLAVALDPSDNVGILDSFFPNADFFLEFERFDRHLDKMKRLGTPHKINYISICSPNYLHDSHIRFALRSEAHAICEKPLVLNPWNAQSLMNLEKEHGKRIFTILQLRLHPSIIQFKQSMDLGREKSQKVQIDLTYITSRGKWYDYSWKGQLEKSGGIATNIGIHFFDMLCWIYGTPKESLVHLNNSHQASGFIDFENAQVRWFLSIDENDLPKVIREKNQRTYRSIKISGEELEFSDGFTDLHTTSYREILAGRGFGPRDAMPSIELAHNIRHASIEKIGSLAHPFLSKSRT